MTKELFSVILDFSVKNREELNKCEEQQTPSTITGRQEENRPNFRKKEKEEEKNV